MAFFNARELKEKMSGGSRNSRELKHEGTVKLWIPNEEFFYARKHFNLHMVPAVKSGAKSCWCMNTSPALTEKCPVCDYIQELWKEWREGNEKQKTAVQGVINKLVDEKYWVNAIDISDKERKFVAVKFTASRIKEILTIIEKHPINTILWSYKKTTTKDKSGNDRVSYSLTEDTDNATANELAQDYDFLWGRSFKEGGPVDLEKVYGKKQTYEQLVDYLTKKSSSHDDEDAELGDDSEAMSLDDISSKPEPAKAAQKTPTPAPKANTAPKKEENLSLDNLSLDGDDLSLESNDLSLDGDEELSLDDLDDKPKVKMVTMPKDFIAKNVKNKLLLGQIVEYFAEQKFIKAENDLNKDVNAANKYLKANDVTVPESLLEETIAL